MKRLLTVLAAIAALGAASLAGHRIADAAHGGMHHASASDRVFKAIAVLHPTQGNNVHGTITFTQIRGRVYVSGEVTGLPPNSTHGFHIHEFGDCSAPDATSAGSHYNPTGHPHAGPGSRQRHAGDLGNLQTDANGRARVELTVDNISVSTGPAMILGRGLIVHAKADDLRTQPTGDAGGRVACGVIGVARDGETKPPAGR